MLLPGLVAGSCKVPASTPRFLRAVTGSATGRGGNGGMNASSSRSMSAILQFGIGVDHPPGLHPGDHPPSVGHLSPITHRSALTTLRDRSVPMPSLAATVGALAPAPARPWHGIRWARLQPRARRGTRRRTSGPAEHREHRPFTEIGHWWSTRLDTTVSTEPAPSNSTSASPMPTRHRTAASAAWALRRATASTSGSGSRPTIRARGSTRANNNASEPVPQPTSTLTSSGRGATYMAARARHRRSRVSATT